MLTANKTATCDPERMAAALRDIDVNCAVLGMALDAMNFADEKLDEEVNEILPNESWTAQLFIDRFPMIQSTRRLSLYAMRDVLKDISASVESVLYRTKVEKSVDNNTADIQE